MNVREIIAFLIFWLIACAFCAAFSLPNWFTVPIILALLLIRETL